MTRKGKKLSWPERVEYHDEKDLARMLWETFMRPKGDANHEGFDVTLTIAGDTGMGKSELALVTALELAKLSGVPFEIKRNVVYTREQLEEAIKTLPRYSPIVVDEAVNVLFARDDAKNSRILKVLDACRSRNLAMMFCMPDFSAMDPKARKSRIRMWIDIRNVGEGVEFVRIRRVASDPHLTDCWNNWAFKEIGTQYERHPNFIGVIRWGRLPPELRAAYNEHKHASELLSDQGDDAKRKDDVASFLAWLDERRREYSGLVEEAARYLDVTPPTVYARMRTAKRKNDEDGDL